MNLLAPFDAAWADRDAAAKADGRPVVGYLANTAPVELIRAAGFLAEQVTGSPQDDTPDALARMEPFFDGWVLSVFQRLIDGRLGHLEALVIPRSSEVMLQLYYHILEYRRLTPSARLPAPILFDILHTPFEVTARYNAGRLAALRDRLGALAGRPVGDAALANAIAEADSVRARLAAVNGLRTADRPRLSGSEMLRIIGASTVMAPADFIAAADALLANAQTLGERAGPRLLVTGSGHDTDAFHRTVEALGVTITGDDHAFGDWWFLDPVGDGEPMRALLEKYHLNAPSPRTFPRERGDARLMLALERARPDAVIFFTEQWDDTLGFDYPTQRDLLAARGIPCLLMKEQSYRHPDRAAQVREVQGLLAGLTAVERAR